MVHKWSDNELSWIDYSRSTTLLELPSHLCKGLNKADDWENVWWMCIVHVCTYIPLYVQVSLCMQEYICVNLCFRVIVFVWIATLQIKRCGWKSPSHLFAVLRNWLRWASAPTFHAAAPEFDHHLGFWAAFVFRSSTHLFEQDKTLKSSCLHPDAKKFSKTRKLTNPK